MPSARWREQYDRTMRWHARITEATVVDERHLDDFHAFFIYFAVVPDKVLLLESLGGETHTFTKVADFGGGFVPALNALSGNPIPRPECAVVLPSGGLAPQPPSATNIFVEAGETEAGPTAGSSILPVGEQHKFQCCIHPWMRTVITVPGHGH